MQASKEFLAELKVLTHVHHLNLVISYDLCKKNSFFKYGWKLNTVLIIWQVRLIGYCVEGSLFLVYEFIENGNLSQHLRGSSGKETEKAKSLKLEVAK